jgi:hypothetical protein
MFATSSDGRYQMSGTIGQPDAGAVLAADGFELRGGFWPGLAGQVTCETGPPTIVHTVAGDREAGAVTSPCTGYIDPRIESDNGVHVDLGVDEIVVAFSERVFRLGPAPLEPPDAGSFEVFETGGEAPPAVALVEQLSPESYRVVLDRIITIGEWTTVKANVQDACGNAIRDEGHLGPGQPEPDRIDLAFLPGDVNQDKIVSPLDLINLRQFLSTGSFHNECADILYFDIDRDGVMPEPQDLLRFRQMLVGSAPATRPWSLEVLGSEQP